MHGECSETGKVRYATARAAHAVICKARWGRRIKVQPRRAYFCKSCQGYHLTSKTDVWRRRSRLSRKLVSARVTSAGEIEDSVHSTNVDMNGTGDVEKNGVLDIRALEEKRDKRRSAK